MALLLSGSVVLLLTFFTSAGEYQVFARSLFTDRVPVVFQTLDLENFRVPVEVDNFLVFQEYKAVAPPAKTTETLLFLVIFGMIAVSGLSLFSYFSRLYFVLAGILWIILLTLSNFNGLDLVSPSSNYPLILLLLGTTAPFLLLYIWGQHLPYWKRWLITFAGFALAGFTLVYLSPKEYPELFIAQHVLVPALGLSVFWLLWAGHGILSGLYILLSRINQSLGLRISIQLLVFGLIYLALLFAMLLRLTGELNLPIPTFNPLYLLFPIGLAAWFGVKNKSEKLPEISGIRWVIQALYLLGFGLVLWTCWKVELASNTPASDLLQHILVYSQISFSIFFLVYLYSNFLSVMDSGKAVESVLYSPYSLPYYHVRIGGLIGMMVLTIFADGVIGVQVNSLSNNILGDYYYDSGQKLEASILYENSWFRYRRNDKAKHSVAQLLFDLNQPTLAKQHLEESFAEKPQPDNIILLADRLHQEEKIFEAVYYLENGLARFPKNEQIATNLALFYVKLGRIDEALELLASLADPVAQANLLALQIKAKKEPNAADFEGNLIGAINRIPARKLAGEEIAESTKDQILRQAEETKNPLLIQAAYRNVWTVPDHLQTSEDLALLDAMIQKPAYLDYIQDLQETASLRSLAAGRIAESIKNLKGLAFRNPGDAAYYLQLSADILASQLDFQKAFVDLKAALDKGFRGLEPYHVDIIRLAGETEYLDSLLIEQGFYSPDLPEDFYSIWADFHELLPQRGMEKWEGIAVESSKISFAKRLLMHKSHGLSVGQIRKLGDYLREKGESTEALERFQANPDFTEAEQLTAFLQWLDAGEELSANPYYTPLILAAADRVPDPLAQYELLNAACEFNRDPVLWIQKAEAARRIGLDNYAEASLSEMRNWVTAEDLDSLLKSNK
ncbi:tetratricopeptide repeat protein [Algoriphagus namhaensis]